MNLSASGGRTRPPLAAFILEGSGLTRSDPDVHTMKGGRMARLSPEEKQYNRRILKKNMKASIPLYIMLLPGLIVLAIFNYLPLFGWKIAFEKFIPAKGIFGDQKFVGMYWFNYMKNYPDFAAALKNTLIISVWKLALGIFLGVFFAILINEVRNRILKRTIQTVVYLPHFLSWIVLAEVFIDILSPSTGIVNQLIQALGGQPIFFLGSNQFFRGTIIATDLWKEFGFNTIVYLAAITSIDPSLYESAVMDGANRLQQIWYITLPGILPIIMLMLILNIGGVMNANFDQIYNMYSPVVYKTGDVLDTLVYRIGLINANYSLSTAISIFKSMVSTVLVGVSYFIAYKFADYRIF